MQFQKKMLLNLLIEHQNNLSNLHDAIFNIIVYTQNVTVLFLTICTFNL